MPFYYYYCETCKQYFEKMHSMSATLKECELCKSKTIMKVPQMPLSIVEENISEKKVGELTKKFIEEAREDLQVQKEEMEKQRKD